MMPLSNSDIEKEKDKLWHKIQDAIRNQNIQELDELLNKSYEKEIYQKIESSDSYDLGLEQISGYRREILNLKYFDRERDGLQLLNYAIENGSLNVINHLKELGIYPTLELLRQYNPPKSDNANMVTYELLSEVYGNKIEFNRETDVVEVLELAKKLLSEQEYLRFIQVNKDKTYLKSDDKILAAVQPFFHFDAQYIKTKNNSDMFSASKRNLLKTWSATQEDAKQLSQRYDELNSEISDKIINISSNVGKKKSLFQAPSRGEVLQNARIQISSILTSEDNPAEKFKQIIQIVINSHNALQTEMNNSGFMKLKWPQYKSTTRDELIALINKNARTYYDIKFDKASLISYSDTKTIDTDAEIIKNFSPKPTSPNPV